MKISRMNPFSGSGKTVAFFDVETEEGFNIKGFTLVEAVMVAVDEVHIGVAGRTVHGLGPLRPAAAVRMRRLVVGADIGFRFDDYSRGPPLLGIVNQDLA